MTEQEREELIEKMAKAAWESDGVLNWEGVEFGRKIYLLEARAALAVAEPVIREQADNALREENARLREALKPFAYIAEHVGEEDARWAVPSAHLRAAAAAIREGGRGMTAEEFAAMERRARMFEAANEKMLADNKRLREENARLRKAVKNAYYEGWQDNASIDDKEDRLHFDWKSSEARAAIREGAENA